MVLVSASGDDGRGPFDLDLASASLEIADLSPPLVTVIEPSGGSVACDSIRILAEVEDALSRVSSVYAYLDDDSTPIPLHLEDPATNPRLYSATRSLPPGLDGAHIITVQAEDAVGNLSDGETVAFEADTAPPVLQVDGPADGSCFSGAAVFDFSVADPHLVGFTALLDGQPYTSGSPIAAEGDHLFEVAAVDACGRQASDARSFTLDSTPPEITIDGVSQGDTVLLGTVIEWAVNDLNLVSATATLDGSPIASPITLDTPGLHTLSVAAADCAGNTAEITIQFTVIEAVLALGGSVTATPPLLEPGDALSLGATATNLGSGLEAVQLILDVIEVSSGTVVATATETIDLVANQSHTMTATPDTTGWELGAYEVRLSARGLFLGQPFDLSLATAALTLADLTAPQLTLISPAPGLACQAVEVAAEATDHLTGVSSVVVSVDGGPPQPLTNTGGSTWTTALTLDQGPHDLGLVATDGAGNSTAEVSVGIDLDTEEPELTLTAPENDACIAESATIEFSADDPHLETLTASLNGAPITTGHVIDEDGAYRLIVTAVDACDRQTVDDRQFVVDTIEPEISVTGIADGETHALGVAVEWEATDANLETATAALDGVPVDPSFTVTVTGSHLLEVEAEDCAGNTAAEAVAFEIVLAEDGLSGTVAAEPTQVEPPGTVLTSAFVANTIDTPYADLGLRLEIIDPTTGGVVADAETTVSLPAGGGADFEHSFATDGLAVGGYELRFSASGSVHGHSFTIGLADTSFEVVDLTAPAVTLLAPAPGLACDPIEVRTEVSDLSAVDSVRVHIDNDPEGLPLAHTGGDLWSAVLSLDEGSHNLGVVATDAAGNSSHPIAVDIDLDLLPPVLTVAAPADGVCRSEPVTITFDAEDAHLETTRARLNGQPISSGEVVADDDDYHLVVSAADACGRSESTTADFIIDATQPVITVIGVGDGDEVEAPVAIEWMIDDANLVDHRRHPRRRGGGIGRRRLNPRQPHPGHRGGGLRRKHRTGRDRLHRHRRPEHRAGCHPTGPDRRRQHPPARSLTGGRCGARAVVGGAIRPRHPGQRWLRLHRRAPVGAARSCRALRAGGCDSRRHHQLRRRTRDHGSRVRALGPRLPAWRHPRSRRRDDGRGLPGMSARRLGKRL